MAKKKNGWIILHRDIRENEVWNNGEPFDVRSAWIDLIMMANYEDAEMIIGKTVYKIKRGQLHTSVKSLSTRWSWSFNKTRAYIRLLKSLQMIQTKSSSIGTTITLINYDKFQVSPQTNETTKSISKGTTVSTTTGTTDGTTNGTQVNNINKVKETERKEKKKKDIGISSTGIPYDHVETVDGEQWFCWKDEQGGWHMENAKKEEYPRW